MAIGCNIQNINTAKFGKTNGADKKADSSGGHVFNEAQGVPLPQYKEEKVKKKRERK